MISKKKNEQKRNNKLLKGFTLIELLAVIVILGILMLVAIPSVTKYIEKSRKSTFITSVKNLVGAVRYGVVSEDSKYDMGNATEKVFALKDIETEKGKMEDVEGYVKVIKTTEGYQFKVKVNGSTIEKNNYCCDEVDIEEFGNNLGKCSTAPTAYKTYVIGDTIEFAGSNWRVIKDSTGNEDYVTLMKERVLTNAELGEYAYNGTYDTMSYYWDDSCHPVAYGYSSSSYSCDNTNDYATSKVKEMLETRYLPTIGESNLKEVDGYKIRLITVDELTSNLGCTSSSCSSSPYASWVHQNFGDQSKIVYAYWTMTPYPDISSNVWIVHSVGLVYNSNVYDVDRGVRPVINLLKSNIS